MPVDHAGAEIGAPSVDHLGVFAEIGGDVAHRHDALAVDGNVGGVDFLGGDIDQLAVADDAIRLDLGAAGFDVVAECGQGRLLRLLSCVASSCKNIVVQSIG